MSEKENESIDHLADTYASTESDAKAYQKAQSATIVAQTKEINTLRKQKEQLEKEFEKLTMDYVQLKALNPSAAGQFDISDQETIAVVQLAILKNLAIQRELTLEETKKCEIFTKLLIQLRGSKPEEKEDKMEALTNDQLIEMMKSVGPG
jgi:hypothetical protein